MINETLSVNYKNSQSIKPPRTVKQQSFKQKNIEPKTKQEDPLSEYPLRLFAYTNEVGAALNPIPGIGPKLFMLSWVPALMYFGADIYNKFVQGEKGDYTKSSKNMAIRQSVFQGLASVILPTVAVIAGQNVASKLSKHFSKDKMTVSQKEDILAEIKRDINQDKLRNYRNSISQILDANQNKSLEEIKKLDEIKKIKSSFFTEVYHDLQIESETLRQHRENSGFGKKIFEFIFTPHRDCEHVSRIKKENFETIVKPYLEAQVDKLVDKRIELQRVLNHDGTLNAKSGEIGSTTLNKIQKLLNKNLANRNISDKNSFVVKECVLSSIQKTELKLSTIKIAGGFVALALLAKPIDHFVEHILIGKFLTPALLKNKNVEKKTNNKPA